MTQNEPCENQIRVQERSSQGYLLEDLESICLTCKCMQGERSCDPDGYRPMRKRKEHAYAGSNIT